MFTHPEKRAVMEQDFSISGRPLYLPALNPWEPVVFSGGYRILAEMRGLRRRTLRDLYILPQVDGMEKLQTFSLELKEVLREAEIAKEMFFQQIKLLYESLFPYLGISHDQLYLANDMHGLLLGFNPSTGDVFVPALGNMPTTWPNQLSSSRGEEAVDFVDTFISDDYLDPELEEGDQESEADAIPEVTITMNPRENLGKLAISKGGFSYALDVEGQAFELQADAVLGMETPFSDMYTLHQKALERAIELDAHAPLAFSDLFRPFINLEMSFKTS